jgi:ribosomal protein L37E
MKCPRCGKSLYKDNWYPMAARCMVCGFWVERPRDAMRGGKR